VDDKFGLLEGAMNLPAGNLAIGLVLKILPRTCQELLYQGSDMTPSVSPSWRTLLEFLSVWQSTKKVISAAIEILEKAITVAETHDRAMVHRPHCNHPIGY